MSEYQYYEFLAVDRPLTAAEQAEVRQLSTRARITATRRIIGNSLEWAFADLNRTVTDVTTLTRRA